MLKNMLNVLNDAYEYEGRLVWLGNITLCFLVNICIAL